MAAAILLRCLVGEALLVYGPIVAQEPLHLIFMLLSKYSALVELRKVKQVLHVLWVKFLVVAGCLLLLGLLRVFGS